MPTASLFLNTSLFAPGDRICVAVSGGADSVALLRALHERRSELGIVLSAVHIEHGIRGSESLEDARFVGELCQRIGVPLSVKTVSVVNRQAATGEGVEEAARTLRYEAFGELDVDAVATAHTRDDQAETVLMKLLRGAWTEGLGGISPVNEVRGRKIVRPLLSVSREEIVQFLKARGQGWREDSTNASLEMTRNRVRHHLLPALREFNPQIAESLANVSELAREDERFWQKETERLLPRVLLPGKPVRGGGRSASTHPEERSVSVDLEGLRSAPASLRRRILRAAAESLGCRIGFAETSRLLTMCGLAPPDQRPDPTVSPRPGAALHLSQGLKAKRTARELQISRSGREE